MLLSTDECFAALAARDRRFDGAFFVGVTSTGIYCRPVCPARTPRRARCRFFPSPASAEREGFRPCLRCKPELAPSHAIGDDSLTIAQRAAAAIRDGLVGDGISLDTLAQRLGVSTRQLRRLVKAELGVTPVELVQTSRLLLAKQLLSQTRVPMIQVVSASGFQSLRRFNALFKVRYRLAPTALRRSLTPRESEPDSVIVATLSYRPPLHWASLMSFLAHRAISGVERVDDRSYARTLKLDGRSGWVRVEPGLQPATVRATISSSLVPVVGGVIARLRMLLDLDARPAAIETALRADAHLTRAMTAAPGLRVPGSVDAFELSWRAVLGQQVSVVAARTLAGRVVERFGASVDHGVEGLTHLSPEPLSIADASVRELAKLGITGSRAYTLQSLARAFADGTLDLSPPFQHERTAGILQSLPGIGAWTTQYILMRACGWPDAFPGTDLVLRRMLGNPTPKEVERIAAAWRPWRAYAAIALWSLASKENK